MWPVPIACYTLLMAFLLVSTIPTFSGKLLGERIAREYVLPIFVAAAALVALLVTYPYETLTLVTIVYLAVIPVSYQRYQQHLRQPSPEPATAAQGSAAALTPEDTGVAGVPAGETKH